MLIAVSRGNDGRNRLILGLQAENIARLLNDMPIMKRLDEDKNLGLEDFENWDLCILGPEDTIRFIAHFGG